MASEYSTLFSNAQAQPAPPASTADADVSAVPPASVTPPPNILPNSPLAQVIRLVQANLDESVILSYVTNSTSTFNLDSDKIIYLNNLGVPNEIVAALMQRDLVLQQQMAASTPPSAPPPPETPPTEPTEPPPAGPTELPPPPPEPTPVTVNYFYSSLAPYGTWVQVPNYGRCWRPTVVVYNSGWQPYCDHGHWVYSDCGWYWASDYSWGVAFHYGRWFHDAHWGWCWWPDTVWAPSWVTWRYSNAYCGWAPLPPFAVYHPGAGFYYHGVGVTVGFDFGLAVSCFTFVPTGHFCDPHPSHYRIGAQDQTRIYHQTTVINNFNFDSHNRTMVNHGIAVQHITDVTRTPIHPVPVRELSISARQPRYVGPGGQQNHRPGVTTESAPQPGSAYDNRIHSMPHGPTQPPNQSPQPNHIGPVVTQTPAGTPGQNPQPHYYSPTPAPISSRTYDNKHIASPRGQQFEEQTPHYTPPAPNRQITVPEEQRQSAPPTANNPTGSTANRSSDPPERSQHQNVSHSNGSPTHSSSSSQSSQSSQSSNRSNNQGANQGGPGH